MLHVLLIPALLQAGLPADIRNILDDPALARASVGVYVKELGGEEMFALHAGKRLAPASVMKLVTCALAYEALGPDFAPATLAWRNGIKVNLLGGGDPGLTIKELIQLAAALKVKPEDTVLFDDGLFGVERYAPGWEVGDLPSGFAAPISALTVNGGRAELWAASGRAWLKPRNFGIAVKGAPSVGLGEIRITRDLMRWTVKVSGGMPSGVAARRIGTISLPDSGFCAARVFHPKAKRAAGLIPPDSIIPIPDPTSPIKLSPEGLAIAMVRSRSVEELVRHCLQESDNHYAETLLRLSGAMAGDSGSWEDSLKMAVGMLERIGVAEDAYHLADGSGLSRRNELTPRSVVRLLEYLIGGENGDRFLDALASPGVGTLKNRLGGVKVWAKTGTLTGVSCLAGVVEAPQARAEIEQSKSKPRLLLFAIMMNHYPGDAKRPREIQDAIVTRLSRG